MKYLLNWSKFNENSFTSFGLGKNDIMYISSCPKDETPVQAHVEKEYQKNNDIDDTDDIDLSVDEFKTDPNYLAKQKEECQKYVDMLNKRFVICNNVNIILELQDYEGSEGYYEAVIKYNSDDTEQNMQAHFIEDNLPNTWNDDRVFTENEYKIWYEDNLEYFS